MKNFSIVGDHHSRFVQAFVEGIQHVFTSKGYHYIDQPIEDIPLVFNCINKERPRPFRRKAQATFVVSIIEDELAVEGLSSDAILKIAYPYLIRSLSNHLIYIAYDSNREDMRQVYFITPEQGRYKLTYREGEEETFYRELYHRLEPLASSQLVINNEFLRDLPEELWTGNDSTFKLREAGKRLDSMNLLPAPFPLQEYVTERDLRHLNKLYGIGGLSYGNLSCRGDEQSFWMSASGVNKANLNVIGQDILLIKDYDSQNNAMRISVPREVTPKRASVDAIEHWMIYREHPDVGAIVHIHAWMDGVKATEINYPCGTIQLAQTVAQLIRESDNPAQTVIGLKNHGLTITGVDLDDIFDRIEGKVIPQVPMN